MSSCWSRCRLDGVLQSQDAALGLRLVTDVRASAHAHHHALVAGAAHDGREHRARRVVAGETSLSMSVKVFRAVSFFKRKNTFGEKQKTSPAAVVNQCGFSARAFFGPERARMVAEGSGAGASCDAPWRPTGRAPRRSAGGRSGGGRSHGGVGGVALRGGDRPARWSPRRGPLSASAALGTPEDRRWRHMGRAGDLGRTLTMPEPLSHTRAETSPSSAMACVCSGVGEAGRVSEQRGARDASVWRRAMLARRALNGEKLIRRAAPETRRCGACGAHTVARTAHDAPFVRSSRVSGSRGTCVARW